MFAAAQSVLSERPILEMVLEMIPQRPLIWCVQPPSSALRCLKAMTSSQPGMLLKAPLPAVLEAPLGEGVKDIDPGYAPPAALRTLLQSAPYLLQMCFGDLRVQTLPVQPPPLSFYRARLDVSMLVLLKTGVSKSLKNSGLFGLWHHIQSFLRVTCTLGGTNSHF